MAESCVEKEYPLIIVLKTLKISRSTWYRHGNKDEGRPANTKGQGRPVVKDDDEEIKNKVIILKKKPFMSRVGHRKLVHYLKRDENTIVNHKRLYRIMKANNLLCDKKKKKKRRGKRICMKRKVMAPNQAWQFDIKYAYLADENKFCYLMVFLDTFNRKVINYHIGYQCKSSDIIFTLEQALKCSGADPTALIIRSDNGPQMTSHQFKKKVNELNIGHEFIPPRTPNANAFIESFFSIVDNEFINELRYGSYKELYSKLVNFIDFYNNKRIHGSLNNMTPNEFTKYYLSERVA